MNTTSVLPGKTITRHNGEQIRRTITTYDAENILRACNTDLFDGEWEISTVFHDGCEIMIGTPTIETYKGIDMIRWVYRVEQTDY